MNIIPFISIYMNFISSMLNKIYILLSIIFLIYIMNGSRCKPSLNLEIDTAYEAPMYLKLLSLNRISNQGS